MNIPPQIQGVLDASDELVSLLRSKGVSIMPTNLLEALEKLDSAKRAYDRFNEDCLTGAPSLRELGEDNVESITLTVETLRERIMAVINTHPNLHVYETLGTLRIVEHDMIERLEKSHK